MTQHPIHQFLNSFIQWATAQLDIQAVALVGSYARNAATPTSDVDLVIIATQPAMYLKNTEWVQYFGQVRQQQIEKYGMLTSVRVWYTDEREVEYGLTDARWAASPLDAGTQRVIADGMQVLFERAPLLSPHQLKG